MIRSLLSIGALQVLSMAILFARTKGLAVALGPEQVGIMGVIDRLLVVVAQTASLTMPFAAVRFLPAAWDEGPASYHALHRSMRRVMLITTTLATVACMMTTLLKPGLWGSELGEHASVLLPAFATVPLLVFVPYVQSALAGRRLHRPALLIVVANSVLMLGTALLAVWHGDLRDVYLYYAVAGLFLIGWPLFKRPAQALRVAATPALAGFLGLPRRVWLLCGSRLGLAFIGPFTWLMMHYQVLDHFGTRTAGWFFAAVSGAVALRAVLGATRATFLMPNIYRDTSPQTRIEWADRYQRALCLLLLATLPAALLFPRAVVRILFSSEFDPGAQHLHYFVVAEFLGSLALTYQNVVIAMERLGVHVLMTATAHVLVIVASMLLIPAHGIAGAAWAVQGAEATLLAGTAIYLRRRFGLGIPLRTLGLFVYAAGALLALGRIGVGLDGYGPLDVLVRAGAYVVVLMGATLFMGPEERSRLRDVIRWPRT
jgi:O-antigen/teichoic acid export membrane protein